MSKENKKVVFECKDLDSTVLFFNVEDVSSVKRTEGDKNVFLTYFGIEIGFNFDESITTLSYVSYKLRDAIYSQLIEKIKGE